MQIRPSEPTITKYDPFKNDCLGRSELEPPLTQFVNRAVGPFVLAVDGSWGSGKTTFLKMWQVKLDAAGNLCLYLNAWKTDFVQDPLIAVVGELSSAMKEQAQDHLDKDNVRKTIDKIEKAANSIARRLFPVGAKLATFGLLDIDSAMEREISAATGAIAENLIQDYDKGKSDIKTFREDLEFLAGAIRISDNKSEKIVIIIDELDRCRPTYAVQLLERIKHLFDVEGVVFILGIDRIQLSHSIKALYGAEFDATRYLKRFIDIDYSLPTIRI
jgi:predicted KAP-like P-loop ATPase